MNYRKNKKKIQIFSQMVLIYKFHIKMQLYFLPELKKFLRTSWVNFYATLVQSKNQKA